MSLPNLSCLRCHTPATGVVFDTFDQASVERLPYDLRTLIKPDDLQDGPNRDRPETCPYCMKPLTEASLAPPGTNKAVIAAVQGPNPCGHLMHQECAIAIYNVNNKVECPVVTCGKTIDPINWQTPLSQVPRERNVVLTYEELLRLLKGGKRKAENIYNEEDRERAEGALETVERLFQRFRRPQARPQAR